MNWISVKDNLPEQDVLVRVKCQSGSIDTNEFETDAKLMSHGKFSCEFDWVRVTHWKYIINE